MNIKTKKILFYLLILFILINFLSFFLIKIKFGENVFDFQNYSKKKNSYKIPHNKSYIHPYLGQIDLDNKKTALNNLSDEPLFFDIFNPKNEQEKDAFKILILGSTQSLLFNKDANNQIFKENVLAKKLIKKFPYKKIVIYNGAVKSSKQPQQLFKLYYLYLISMSFDIVIQIDGVQGITHPIVKNYPMKEEGIYPRRYSDQIASMASDFSCSENSDSHSKRVTFIPVYEVYSLYKIRSCLKKILKKYDMNWNNIEYTGKRGLEEFSQRAIKIWERSSNQMENFSNQKDFFYLQVMLPNKFYSKKKISSEEKNYFKKHEYSEVIKKNYGLKNFKNIGVKHSLDLRSVFENTDKTVYTRDCCDYNSFGISIISDKIIEYLNSNYID